MKLHTHPEEFRELITVVANENISLSLLLNVTIILS